MPNAAIKKTIINRKKNSMFRRITLFIEESLIKRIQIINSIFSIPCFIQYYAGLKRIMNIEC